MEDEVVRKRRWLTPERFLDLLGGANLIPGPSSSELAVYIGYDRAGLLGLLAAGIGFVFPAALITALLAWAYLRFGHLPQVSGILYGVKPVTIAIIAQALWNLGPKAAKTRAHVGICIAALAATLMHVDALVVLLAAGALSMLVDGALRGPRGVSAIALPGLALGASGLAVPVTLFGILLVFLKMGSVVFGSGYVLLAFLRADIVERLHWLTEAQLLDAVVVGQITPGPVFTTATFIGYVLAGVPGAVLATIGIFLPGFVLVAVSRPLLARVRQSRSAGAFLDGVNVAALSLMAGVTFQLGQAAIIDVSTLVLALVSCALVFRWRVNSAWLLIAAATVGCLMHRGS